MAASPFHGIFGSTGQQTGKSVFSFDEEEAPDTPLKSTAPAAGQGRLAVDIYEQDDYYIVKAPIAGVRLADIDIEVNDHVLTIRGQRSQTDPVPENQYYLQECYWGSFSRSVTLPCEIDAKLVKATFNKDSVLKILIPKEKKIKIVRIQEG